MRIRLLLFNSIRGRSSLPLGRVEYESVTLSSYSSSSSPADNEFSQVFNRTTLQHSTLSINGHTSSMERLRFMDRYLATGGRDCTVKIWALS